MEDVSKGGRSNFGDSITRKTGIEKIPVFFCPARNSTYSKYGLIPMVIVPMALGILVKNSKYGAPFFLFSFSTIVAIY